MAQKLLLADDSVTVQRVIELTFADEGMEVVAVGNGRQAVERLDHDAPDIVLADVSMPELDGYEVAAHVKRTPGLSHIPVVLLTGAFEQVDEARARAVGCDGVLAKPFEPHMVIALVRQLLGHPVGDDLAREGRPAAPGTPGLSAGYPFEPGAAAAPPAGSLDEYFDRLDEALSAQSHAQVARPPVPAEEEPAAPAKRSSLAQAFEALLADELGEAPIASVEPEQTPPAAEASSTLAVTDQLVDQLAERVLERISDLIVREAVTRHVVEVAERLVRDEIRRIRTEA